MGVGISTDSLLFSQYCGQGPASQTGEVLILHAFCWLMKETGKGERCSETKEDADVSTWPHPKHR